MLDDAPMVEDDDLVGIAYGGETVGDNEGGAPAHDAIHAALHQLLRVGIDGASGLVEDEHRRIRHGCSRNRQQLALALREVAAVAAEHRVIAVGETQDEVVGTHQPCSLAALLVGGIQPAVADVVEHRCREEMCLLQHDAHRTAQGIELDVVDGNAIVEDSTPFCPRSPPFVPRGGH